VSAVVVADSSNLGKELDGCCCASRDVKSMLFAILAWRILSIDFRTPAVPQADGLPEVEPASSTCNFKSRFNQLRKGELWLLSSDFLVTVPDSLATQVTPY
jgi:hypothetical protein